MRPGTSRCDRCSPMALVPRGATVGVPEVNVFVLQRYSVWLGLAVVGCPTYTRTHVLCRLAWIRSACGDSSMPGAQALRGSQGRLVWACLLYTSDAADDLTR